MSDHNEIDNSSQAADPESEAETRREFLKTVANGAAKGAIIAPAVAMLLSASTRSAKAATSGCGCGGGSIL